MSEPKKYSLKPIETQLLNVITQQQANLLSNTLSFIAIERLALQIDQNTRFQINDDMTEITVTQETPEADVITEAPKESK
jgi:hypothetical protein